MDSTFFGTRPGTRVVHIIPTPLAPLGARFSGSNNDYCAVRPARWVRPRATFLGILDHSPAGRSSGRQTKRQLSPLVRKWQLCDDCALRVTERQRSGSQPRQNSLMISSSRDPGPLSPKRPTWSLPARCGTRVQDSNTTRSSAAQVQKQEAERQEVITSPWFSLTSTTSPVLAGNSPNLAAAQPPHCGVAARSAGQRAAQRESSAAAGGGERGVAAELVAWSWQTPRRSPVLERGVRRAGQRVAQQRDSSALRCGVLRAWQSSWRGAGSPRLGEAPPSTTARPPRSRSAPASPPRSGTERK